MPSAIAAKGRRSARARLGTVDVEDAAAALVTFANGAYGVLETSRVTIGKRVSLLRRGLSGRRARPTGTSSGRTSSGSACRATRSTFGYRRVLVNPSHPGATELLIAGTDGTGIGWLGRGARCGSSS